MSASTILIIVLVAVVAAIILGSIFKINMGLIALVFACIIGGYMLGVKPREIYTYWPAGIIIQIIAITFFYGFVSETGAIEALAKRIMYVLQDRFWLMPFAIFIMTAGLGYIGVNPMGINALMLPIVAGICMYTNRSPVTLFLIFGAGNTAGILSPLGSAGIVANGMLSAIVGESAAPVVSRMYLNNLLLSVIIFAVWYIVFRCWGMKVDDEHKMIIAQKPDKFTKSQKQVLTIMLITILFFIVVGVFRITIISSALDVGWVYIIAGAICVILKVADQRKVITTRIPWSIVLLVGGFSILLTILTKNGGTELISSAVNDNVSTDAIPPLMGLLAGLTSLFSDSIGVVLPLYIPVCAGTVAAGVSACAVFSAAIIGALSTGCAPFSTGGAMVLSFTPDAIKKKMFWVMLLSAAVNLVLVIILSAIGIFG